MRVSGTLLSLCLALAASPLHAQVKVGDPWVRATVHGQKATGAFLTLSTSVPAALMGVRSPVAEVAELHAMKMEEGVMKMRPIETIALTPDHPVELKPGSLHIMLMELKTQLKAGESVPLILVIKNQEGRETETEITAEVRPLSHAPVHPAP